MSRSLNQCNFIGNLGADPELKTLPGGDRVANFSIGVSDDYTKDGQKVEQTEWVRVVAYRKLAEVCGEYLRKGSKVFISGRMKTRSWEKDGQKFYATEIIANEMQLLDSKRDAAPQPRQVSGNDYRNARNGVPPASFDDESIPF